MHTSMCGRGGGGPNSCHWVVFANLVRIWKCALIVVDMYTQDISYYSYLIFISNI